MKLRIDRWFGGFVVGVATVGYLLYYSPFIAFWIVRYGWWSFRLWLAHLLDRFDVAFDHPMHPWFCNFVVAVWPDDDLELGHFHDASACEWCSQFWSDGDDA